MQEKTRRDFLLKTGIVSATLMIPGSTAFAFQEEAAEKTSAEVEVSPTEDLMREHAC